MKGRHGAQLLGAIACETPFGPWWRSRCMYRHPLLFFSCSHGHNGQIRARSRSGRVAHGEGQSPSEEALLGRQCNRTHGRHPPCRGTSHRTSLQARGRPATGLRKSSFEASREAWGPGRLRHATAEPRKCRHCASSTQCPGSSRRRSSQPRLTCSHQGRAAPDCTSCAVAPRRRGPGAAASCGRDNPTPRDRTP